MEESDYRDNITSTPKPEPSLRGKNHHFTTVCLSSEKKKLINFIYRQRIRFPEMQTEVSNLTFVQTFLSKKKSAGEFNRGFCCCCLFLFFVVVAYFGRIIVQLKSKSSPNGTF